MAHTTADALIERLRLEPHPEEGGFFRETYRSGAQYAAPQGARSVATAIYYLLSPTTFSAFHRLPGDEIFHFYAGDPVELFELAADGATTRTVLGSNVLAGHVPQHVVRGGQWQGSRLVAGGDYALLGTTMSPGFDFEDYEDGDRKRLCEVFPGEHELITSLTRVR